MKLLEALVFLFKGMLFLDGHLTRDVDSHGTGTGCAQSPGGCG